jgi:hypothetical protein
VNDFGVHGRASLREENSSASLKFLVWIADRVIPGDDGDNGWNNPPATSIEYNRIAFP